MPRDGDFKRLVRRRMCKTGEAYTSARAHLARRQLPGEEAAGEPFDRFTARARRALAAAHADATAADGEIGAEHLLAGLLRDEHSMAAKVLEQLGVDRRALGRPPRRDGAPVPAGVRVNREARRAIELAVREAAGLGHGFVGTEHLLLGILAEGARPRAWRSAVRGPISTAPASGPVAGWRFGPRRRGLTPGSRCRPATSRRCWSGRGTTG